MIKNLNSFFQRGFGETLAENEQIISKRKIHWGICLPALGILALGLYIRAKSHVYALLDFVPQQLMNHLPEQAQTIVQENLSGLFINPIKWLSSLVLIYAFWRLYKAIVTYMTTIIYSSQHRLFIHTGLIKSQQVELLWSQVDAFQITKGLIGRFLNYGNITIHSVGSMTTRIPSVQNPDHLHSEIIALRFNKT